MATQDQIDTRPAPFLDFVMEASLCGALAAFVLWQSLALVLAALCIVWLLGMAVASTIGA